MPKTLPPKKTKILPRKKSVGAKSSVVKRPSVEDSIPTKSVIKLVDEPEYNSFVCFAISLLKKIRLIFRICLIALVATIIGVVFIINNTDPNNYRDDIENYIEFTTGKRAEISGNLRWKIFSFEPAIKVDGLTIKNDSWSSNPDFITTDTIIATISLKNLFSHKITINTIILDTPKIYIDVSKKGSRNWLLPTNNLINDNPQKTASDESSSDSVQSPDSLLKKHYSHDSRDFEINIKNIRINDAEIFYNNQQKNINEKFTINYLNITSSSSNSPILVFLETKYKWMNLSGSFKLNSLYDILINPNKINITGVASLNNMDIKFSGLLSDIKKKTPSFSASVFLDIQNIKSSLAPVVKLPQISPIRAEFELIATDTFLSLKKVDINYKNMELSGTSEITMQSGKKPNIRADFSIPLFDIPTLFYPAWEPAYFNRIRNHIEKTKSDKKILIENPKAFRNIPLPVSELNFANINLALHISKLKAMPEMEIDDIKLLAILSDGKGVISPLSFNYMGGNVNINILANNTNNTFNGQVGIKGENVNIGKIVDSTGYRNVFNGGNTNIDIILSGFGDNLAKFMEHLNGYIKVYTTSNITGYRIESILMAGDLFTSIFKFLRDDVVGTIRGRDTKDKSDIHCAVVNLNVHNGQTESNRGIAVETSSANIVIDGLVNFGTEYLDVSIITVVKEGLKLSGNLADMIKIEGAMAEPNIIINKNGLINNVAKTTIATALAGALTGGISLVATGIGFFTKSWIDNISSDSHPCLTALEGRSAKKDPKIAAEFRAQNLIKQNMNMELQSETKKLDTITRNKIATEKSRIKSSNK